MNTTLDRLMQLAVVKERSDGTFFAIVPPVAHRAFGEGPSHVDSLQRLRAELSAKLPTVLHSFRVITGREA